MHTSTPQATLVGQKPLVGHGAFYRPELDVLRFFAFIMVFLTHAPRPDFIQKYHLSGLVDTGAAGVFVFFLLSAYLIAELLLRERERTGTVHIKMFFVRRVLRIWPLYFLAIAAGYLFGHVGPAEPVHPHAIFYLLLLAGNFAVSHHGWHYLGVLFPLWSLSIEEQFYLAIPGLAKLGGAKALKIASAVCLVVAYLTIAWLAHRPAVESYVLTTNSLVNFQFFAAGTIVALVLHKRTWSLSRVTRVLTLLACPVLLYVATKLRLPHQALGAVVASCLAYALTLGGCLALFLGTLGAKINPPKVLSYLGRISFGLYVWHTFVLGAVFYPWQDRAPQWSFSQNHVILADALALAVTVMMAAISYQFFERPILRFKQHFNR